MVSYSAVLHKDLGAPSSYLEWVWTTSVSPDGRLGHSPLDLWTLGSLPTGLVLGGMLSCLEWRQPGFRRTPVVTGVFTDITELSVYQVMA